MNEAMSATEGLINILLFSSISIVLFFILKSKKKDDNSTES